jgi:LmbE family N-acetylglucosaminyl deacetylase
MRESIQNNETIRIKIQELLERFQLKKTIENPSEIAIVAAHQDDESIAFGSLIKRISKCLIVHVTDGAPDNPKEWKGADTRDQYAHIRDRELDIALDRAGHIGERVSLGLVDQGAALRLAENARRLAELFEKRGIRIVMTHAYEGGHPDHDSAAFIVHAAKELMKKRGLELSIIEAPLYRMVGQELVSQNFTSNGDSKIFEIDLTKDEMLSKSMLFDAHRSQTGTFNQLLRNRPESRVMSTEKEWVREAPKYDFSELPNDGNLSYIFANSGLKEKWRTLTTQALRDLELT